MFQEFNIDGIVAMCRNVPYFNNTGYSVVVYINEEYVGSIEKSDVDAPYFKDKLREFIKENV